MHCPKCGAEQMPGNIRFCRACGFSLSGVKELILPDEKAAKANKTRFETAFNQGLLLMLISLVSAIVLTLLNDAGLIPQLYTKSIAAIFLLAGLFRMFYPYVVGKSSSHPGSEDPSSDTETQVGLSETPLPLRTARSIPVSEFTLQSWETAELVQQPPSVTEPTTRKLSVRDRND